MVWAQKAAYLLGWRFLGFVAWARVLDGRVSAIGYAIDPDAFFGWPRSALIAAHSVHGFWRNHKLPMPVRSTDDQNPQFRMWGGEYSIQVIYTADAPQELIFHAFQVDLSCFWGIRGCSSFSQVAPALRKDEQGIEAATIKRLHSQNPCPDEMLAARIRYLPGVSVALRDVVDSSQPMLLKPDARMLIFQGATFESCQTVPATPTAEAAVRAVAPAPRLREEEMSGFGPNS